MNYYLAQGDQQVGPFSYEELLDQAQRGAVRVDAGTLAWRVGMAQWEPVARIPELAALLSAPAAGPPVTDAEPPLDAPAGYPAGVSADAAASMAPGSAPSEGALAATAPQGPLAYAQPHAASSASGLAVASMVLGLIGIPLMCVGFGIASPVCGVLAIVFGTMARKRIDRGEAGGRGQATTGIVAGIVTLALLVLLIVLALVLGLTMLGLAASSGN